MFSAVDTDGQAARQRLRPMIAALLSHRLTDYVRPLGIEADINALLEKGGRERLEQEMPDAWIDQMAIVGTPDECAASIRRLMDAGANSVVLVPEHLGIDGLEQAAKVIA
jgi:alkanesulfonate monooxygenase SsuD/methylene tetrahydromethanopterin reductase-like flavin-dependent oxidoreductase (luciferase family)